MSAGDAQPAAAAHACGRVASQNVVSKSASKVTMRRRKTGIYIRLAKLSCGIDDDSREADFRQKPYGVTCALPPAERKRMKEETFHYMRACSQSRASTCTASAEIS